MKPRVSQLAQSGASTRQALLWDGSEWTPDDVAAVDTSFDDTGLSHVTASNVQDAIEELDAAISAGGGGGGYTVQTYTPTWTALTTNPALGNGTIDGRYLTVDKFCRVLLTISMGSTTTYGTGAWRFSIPSGLTIPDVKPAGGSASCGAAVARDASTGFYYICSSQVAAHSNSTPDTILVVRGQGANDALGTGVPFAWASTDFLHISIEFPID